jgi:hypothetical protein
VEQDVPSHSIAAVLFYTPAVSRRFAIVTTLFRRRCRRPLLYTSSQPPLSGCFHTPSHRRRPLLQTSSHPSQASGPAAHQVVASP